MSDLPDIATLAALARDRRENAARAREHARNLGNKPAQEALQKYADELDAEAAKLNAEIAVLKLKAADAAGADEDIAALKPPPAPSEPEPDKDG